MRTLVADLFLLLFGASIVVTYFSIRLGLLRVPAAALSGWVSSALFLFFFSALRGADPLQAALIGFFLGLLFTGTSASIGAFFYANSAADQKGKGRS